MAPLAINKTIADKRITRNPAITEYATALTKAGFKAKVAEWAKATSAGLAYYTVAAFGYDQVKKIKRMAKNGPLFAVLSTNSSKILARIAAVISCAKTPKIVTVAGWSTKDGINWTYRISSSPIRDIEVVARPSDKRKFRTLVGSCFKAKDTQSGTGNLTWGLTVRRRVNGNNFDKIGISVAHAFACTEPDDPIGWTGGQGNPQHADNELLVCVATLNGQCDKCVARSCSTACSNTTTRQWAPSNLIWRSKVDQFLDLSFAVIPNDPSPPIVPLNLRLFGNYLQGQDPANYGGTHLQNCRQAFATVTGADTMIVSMDECYNLAFMNGAEVTTYVFKCGAYSGWTFGFLYSSDAREIAVRGCRKDGKLLSEEGDCGSIWFIIDPKAGRVRPVSCLTSSDVDDFQDYSFTFHRMIGPEDLYRQTMVELANWDGDEIYMEAADSYVW